MFGLSSQTATKTWSQPDGGDELVVHESHRFVVRFEPYPETSGPQPGHHNPDFDDNDPDADLCR